MKWLIGSVKYDNVPERDDLHASGLNLMRTVAVIIGKYVFRDFCCSSIASLFVYFGSCSTLKSYSRR